MTETLATGPLDSDAYKHQARILQAQHYCRPVIFDGREQFVHTASSRLAGGRVEMDVYLAGIAGAIDSARITLAEPAKEAK
jgi:hypothetical protein